MTISKIIRKVGRAAIKYSPLIFAVIAGASTVETVVCAVKETKVRTEIPEDAKLIEKVVTTAKDYKRTIIFTTASLASIGISTAIGWKRSKRLSGQLEHSTKLLAAYTKAIGATAGAECSKSLSQYMAENSEKPEFDNEDDGKELFYFEAIGEWFRAKKEDLLWSMYYSNGYFVNNGELFLTDFFDSADAEFNNKELVYDRYNGYGWFIDDNWINDYETQSIYFNFDNEPKHLDDGLEYRIFYCDISPTYYEDLDFAWFCHNAKVDPVTGEVIPMEEYLRTREAADNYEAMLENCT